MAIRKRNANKRFSRRYGSTYFNKIEREKRYSKRAATGASRLARSRAAGAIPSTFTFTRERNRMILPADEGKLLAIHNGVRYIFLGMVARKHMGVKLGEFAFTKQKRIFIHQDNKIEMKRRKKASASRKGKLRTPKQGGGGKGKGSPSPSKGKKVGSMKKKVKALPKAKAKSKGRG